MHMCRTHLVYIWARCHAKAVEQDLLVAYPVIDIHDISHITTLLVVAGHIFFHLRSIHYHLKIRKLPLLLMVGISY